MSPFAQIANALKSYVEAHFAELGASDKAYVKLNNRWWRDEVKGARAPADLPAVDIRPVSPNDVKPFATSSSGLFVKSYELGVFTDETVPDEVLFEVQWQLIRVAAKAQMDRLGLPSLVTAVQIASTTETNQDTQASRNRSTWTGTVVLSVQFQIPRADIVPAT